MLILEQVEKKTGVTKGRALNLSRRRGRKKLTKDGAYPGARARRSRRDLGSGGEGCILYLYNVMTEKRLKRFLYIKAACYYVRPRAHTLSIYNPENIS